MKYFLIAFLISLFFSCASGQKDTGDATSGNQADTTYNDYLSQLETDLPGQWENMSMRVVVNTFNRSDTSFIVDINEENWELKMTIKPILTTILNDGTYTSEFRNSFDSLIYRPKGTWLLDGDTLIMEDQQATYKYQIFIDGSRAEFRSIMDWDGDGDMDDEYFGIQQKIAP